MLPSSDTHPPVRYIKLGQGGAWAERCLAHGEIHFGHHSVPHDLAQMRDRDLLISFLMRNGRASGKAADFAREILDFYMLGEDTVWITFEQGRLWWARAHAEVIWLGGNGDTGARLRRTIEPWRDTDLKGGVLAQSALSTRLTKVAGYRQTLCRIQQPDYLLRKIAGEAEPVVQAANRAREALLASADHLIGSLHWADFETFVDLVLARNGWHRTSALGGTMKDADLVVEQTVTGESALVQVKSAASQATLDDYMQRFDDSLEWSRLIFVCHSPKGVLDAKRRLDVLVWT